MASKAQRTHVLPFPSTLRRESPVRLPFEIPGEVVPLPVAAPPAKPPRRNEADAHAPFSSSLARVVSLIGTAMRDMSDAEAEAFVSYTERAVPAARSLAMEGR